MRYARVTALGVAALMLVGAFVYTYAQSTTDPQSTTEKPGTTQPGPMHKMEQKVKGAATGAKTEVTDSWGRRR